MIDTPLIECVDRAIPTRKLKVRWRSLG